MLTIKRNTIVYILCSSNTVTGGPEALHQLCDKINANGGHAEMLYMDYGTEVLNPKAKTHIRYRHYNIRVASEVADDKNNVLVVPELWPQFLQNYKQIQKCIWWLSVNYGEAVFKLSFTDNSIYHLYQSWYAHAFLTRKNAANVYPLFDYLSIRSSQTQPRKERIVIYNPKKGLETTLKIIDCCAGNNIVFTPLQNLTRPEMIQLMKRSMLYIDFGEHPGKDRIPREAAIYNNVVITSKLGSAACFDDLPFPEKYKFSPTDMEHIKAAVLSAIDNYEEAVKDFDYYKRVINNQETEFTVQAVNLFCPGKIVTVFSFSLQSATGIRQIRKIFNDRVEQLANKVRKNLPASAKSKIKKIGLH